MAALPTGIVTFLFTDIEGSTRLWERDRAAMTRAARRHDEIFDAAIANHNGVLFKHVGDAVQAAFSTPIDAVSAAIAAQRALAAEPCRRPAPSGPAWPSIAARRSLTTVAIITRSRVSTVSPGSWHPDTAGRCSCLTRFDKRSAKRFLIRSRCAIWDVTGCAISWNRS